MPAVPQQIIDQLSQQRDGLVVNRDHYASELPALEAQITALNDILGTLTVDTE